jgi:hypothetical protein
MKLWIVSVAGFVLLVPQRSRADFKYTETTKITGGALGGLMKFASRAGGKGSGPESSSYYIKGNRMRVEEGDAEIQIIDLDVRHIVRVDAKRHTYEVLTFEEMRAQLEQFRQARKTDSNGQPQLFATVKVKPTQNTRTILGQATHEVQATVEMEPSEESGSTGTGALTLTSDIWVAPAVGGYEEVRNFFPRMMHEMNWAPSRSIGADPRMAKAMEEVRKSSSAVSGFPLWASVEMTAKSAASKETSQQRHESDDSSGTENIPTRVPTSKQDAANTALGGLLGLEKHQKIPGDAASTKDGGASDTESGALMKATTEVTSFSNSALEPSIFEIPAGYRQVQNSKAGQ